MRSENSIYSALNELYSIKSRTEDKLKDRNPHGFLQEVLNKTNKAIEYLENTLNTQKEIKKEISQILQLDCMVNEYNEDEIPF